MARPKASHKEFEQYTPKAHGGQGSDGRAPGYDPRVATVTPALVPNVPVFRDAKDAKLSGYGGPVATSFPDEMLGAVRSNVRSYSRGIHVGERLNPASYIWPDEFNPDTALEMEAKGLKWAPADTTTNEMHGGSFGVYSIPGEGVDQIDPGRQSILQKLLPGWR